MVFLPLAQITGSMAAFAIVGILVMLSASRYLRRARRCQQILIEGDMVRYYEESLALRNSWQPWSMLDRWLCPPGSHSLRGWLHFWEGDPQQARACFEGGLKLARKPKFRSMIYDGLASSIAWGGQAGEWEEFQKTVDAWMREHPLPGSSWEGVTIYCCAVAGRLEAARGFALEWFASDRSEMPPNLLSTTAARKHALQVMRADAILAALEAARQAEQWDIYDHYLDALLALKLRSVYLLAYCTIFLGIRAAVREDRGELESHSANLQDVVARYPRNHILVGEVIRGMAQIYECAGECAKAWDVIAPILNESGSPIERSLRADIAARLLEKLDRPDEAEGWRRRSAELAPGAFWNRLERVAEPDPELVAAIDAWLDKPVEVCQQNAPLTQPDTPLPPVVSPMCWAVWILGILALTPLLGALVAPVVLVLSLILLAKRRPLPHDHRVGALGFTVALASLAFGGCVVANIVLNARATHEVATASAPVSAPSGVASETGTESAAVAEEVFEDKPLWRQRFNRLFRTDDVESGDSAGNTDEAEARIPLRAGILWVAVLILSTAMHEFGHALAAFWSGDSTARDRGRLTLNPIRHLSLIGSFIVPGIMLMLPGNAAIAWAKPVPFQPDRLRRQRSGRLAVALAGVSANLAIALACSCVLSLAVMFLARNWPEAEIGNFFNPFAIITISDAAHPDLWSLGLDILRTAVLVNALLFVFNLLPIPPLDGAHVIQAIAPAPLANWLNRMRGTGVVFLLVLIGLGGLNMVLVPGVLLGMLLTAVAVLLAAI